MKTALKFFTILLLISVIGCSKDDSTATLLPVEKEPLKSSAKQITSFAFDATDNAALNETLAAAINENDKTISATVAYGTDLTAFTPTIVASDKAGVTPTGTQNFSTPVAYTITAEDNSKTTYTATITPAPNSEKAISSFQFFLSENPFDVNVIADIDEDIKLITFDVPDGANISALLPNIQISDNASISPEGLQNFEEPVTYTLTAQDGSTTTYQVKAILSQRAILLAIYNASPDNSLGWDTESADISNWQGVNTDEDGNIIELFLSDKNLSVLPPRIGNLTNLTSLYLTGNQLTEIPIQIEQLTHLNTLHLLNNKLTGIPVEIGKLTNLTELVLTGNKLTEISIEIEKLINLTGLYLGDNQLTQIPLEIGNLTNLTDLRLTSNQLTQIPVEIGKLTNLTVLDLSDNQLTQIPVEIGNLTNLTAFSLRNNQLAEILIEIGKLTNLTQLILSDNQLADLPSEIGNLTSLTNLNLNKNQLTGIPSEIGKLTSITDLYLQQNPLITIPQAVCDLETNYGTTIHMEAGVTCK